MSNSVKMIRIMARSNSRAGIKPSYSVPKTSHSRIDNLFTKTRSNKYDLIVSKYSIERHNSYTSNVWCVFLFSLTWDWFTAHGDIIWKIKWLEEVIIGSLLPLGELEDSQDKKKDILFQTSSENYRSTADGQPLILIRTTPSGCNVQSIWCSSLSPGTRIRSIQYWDWRIAVRDCYS